ncbi:entry exclusion lipoprotein TrbK [Marinomonas ostreistagni]|uniref:Entry exclusion lipoprotein TrbK n=1 Tax=Marinomonas ostreistagni TaxID=359209 RepID=A0ABS0ZFW2_9GAMM|nr:entry exclusion lipoprotein TrbK [Marinomonas ostreistagni]MBJ7552520.1 entry exclusion lipoprotein TrbK [Marinomonas ostreistagni]
MKNIKPIYIAGFMAVAALTTACSEKMPAVNDENCTQDSIQQIDDLKIREDFSDQCFDYRIEQGKEKAKTLYEDGKDAVGEAYDETAEAMENGADAVGDAWEDGVDAIKDGANNAETEVENATN